MLPDPAGLLDLPQGFSYRVISSLGETMSDGFTVPDAAERAGLLAAFGIVVVPDGRGDFVHNAAIHVVEPDGRLRLSQRRFTNLGDPAAPGKWQVPVVLSWSKQGRLHRERLLLTDETATFAVPGLVDADWIYPNAGEAGYYRWSLPAEHNLRLARHAAANIGGGQLDHAVTMGFSAAIAQILLLDLVFSVDSIITAVGMTDHIPIMVIAVVVASPGMTCAIHATTRGSGLGRMSSDNTLVSMTIMK